MTGSITISVLPDRLYKISGPAGVDAYYCDIKVLGSGANNFFIANNVTTLILESASPVSGSITVTEVMRNYYDAYDGNGGTWCFQPSVDRWTSQYSFRPEWITMVGNRLVTFKNGMLYMHNSATRNTFYGQAYDSSLTVAHSDAGSEIKTYMSIGVEGEKPDIAHIRTEVPNVQSSDLRSADFEVKEGVNYSPIYMDRLSPNATGTPEQRLLKGDRIRGEVGLFHIIFTNPTVAKVVKFFSVVFNPSRGHDS